MPLSEFMDEEKLALIMDTYQKLTTSMTGIQKLLEDLPDDVKDPLLAMMLGHLELSQKMANVYTKFQAFHKEVKSLGKFPVLEMLLRLRYIVPKQQILLAMQKIMVRMRHALEDAPIDPRKRDEWLRTHTPQIDLTVLGGPEDE